MPPDTYHHGAVRRAVLDAAIAVIEESGPGAISLRDLARRIEVSHAAPAHHFTNKQGVFTALAAEGFQQFDAVLAAAAAHGSIADLGVAYVRFALEHRAHFEVMFRPDLFDADDPAVAGPRESAWTRLAESAAAADTQASDVPTEVAELGAWGLVHGLCTLATAHAVDIGSPGEAERVVRAASAMLFRP